ncbi:MAG: hypothetical protein HYZ22_12660 [Chloroflexi bacterium]|nr:hypothetical protein [Chloroflexota bacterium]
MLYVYSVLLFALGLATGIPAILLFRRMENIRKHSSTTFGVVRSAGESREWNFLGEVGRSARPLVAFRVQDTEHLVEMTDSSGFMNRRYETGVTVEVVYQKETPWKAYLQKEWQIARRDLWIAAAELVAAAVLWGVGVYLGIPV